MSAANDNSVPRAFSLGLGAIGVGAAAGLFTPVNGGFTAAASIITRIDAAGGNRDAARGAVVTGGDHATGVTLRIRAASLGKLRSVTGRGAPGRTALFVVPPARGTRVDAFA